MNKTSINENVITALACEVACDIRTEFAPKTNKSWSLLSKSDIARIVQNQKELNNTLRKLTNHNLRVFLDKYNMDTPEYKIFLEYLRIKLTKWPKN